MEESKQYINPLADRESEEPIEVDTFLIEDEWQSVSTEGKYLDPKEKYIRPRYTLSYNGVPFAPLGGIHGLTGQPGHGKTFTFTQLIVAILRGEFYGLRYELSRDIPQPKVLYIDTEMEKGNTQLVMLRVYEMMGWEKGTEQEQFKILWLREEVKAVERWKLTLKAINELKPTVVFLDGLIDVVGDFNDNKECQAIIYKCMATASHYGLSMWCLLHENPGSTKMVGHAGSFLERKATDVLKTKKDKESGVVQFEVSQSKARARDLDAWVFTIEDDTNHYGHPVIQIKEEQYTLPTKMIYDTSMVDVIGDDTTSFTALRERMRKAFGIGSGTAKEIINQAVNEGILIRKGEKYTKPKPLDDMDKLDDDERPFFRGGRLTDR